LSVLPHKKEFIEKHGIYCSGFLLEELKEKILYEIKLFLDGKSASNEDIQKANEINKVLKEVDDSNQKIEEKLKSNSKQST
jgi:CO dehydrogenase/acetyl-CoA synthase beta subunit